MPNSFICYRKKDLLHACFEIKRKESILKDKKSVLMKLFYLYI